MKLYLYHYHLMVPLKDGSVTHCTGCISRDRKIDNSEEYESAIEFICSVQKRKLKETIISELSLLNP